MFDFLKKKLKDSVEKLTKKTEGGEASFKTEGKAEQEEPKEEAPQEMPKEVLKHEPKPKMEKEAPRIEKPHKLERRRLLTPSVEQAPEKLRVKEPAPEPEPAEPAIEKEVEKPEQEKRGFFGRFREKVTTRALSDSDIEEFFQETENDMLEANVALEVVDFMKKSLKQRLAEKQAKRFGAKDLVKEAFEDSLYEVVNQGDVNLESVIKKARSEGRPACLIFLGFNGSGKTTSIAKLAHYLKEKGHIPVIAAADTFRAASIEQLEVHGEKLGVKVIKHQYGADSAAVVFDAVKFAKTKGCDIVLADTAGRSHADKNLMDELSKVVRVNKPDLRVLVVDSLTGNDAVEQAKTFQKAAGVDAIVLTKIDVNKKGGAILSVCYAIKKPILFLGSGQDYKSIEMFEPRRFVKELLE
ncbi:MAG: signal recognition particle-docking protein FtsY [Candidatus Aenigmarchaeota archaeon]|nr:signal recognition particle-docking protein FtsY [Candidatus Aenigmarchaeota archaeon]